MFEKCEFCAVKSAKCLQIDEASITNKDKPLTALEALHIFNKELVNRIVSTTKLGFICLKCADTLEICYTFAQQIQHAQKHLQSSAEIVSKIEQGTKRKKLADVVAKVSPRKTVRPLLPKTAEYKSPSTQICPAKLVRSYKCVECPQLLSSFRQLKQHEATHELADISICNFCCSLFANAETLDKHKRERHADSQYVCLPCARQYKNKGHLLKHVVHAHQRNELIYYCCLCPRPTTTPIVYDSKLALQQHFQAVHLHMPSQEDVDDVEIEMNEEFLDEFLMHNTNENSFQFSEWDALDLHLPDVLHLNEHNSGEHTGSDGTLAAYKCPNCCEQFADLKTLLVHLAQLHSLQLLICHQCEASFKNIEDLWKHRKTHRLKERSKSEKHSIGLQAHECPYCGKIFPALINLKQHMRNIHAQLKKHVCLLCDKQFATLDHLKKHVLSQHQNERKHVCDVCAKRFTQLCHLKQHLAIHTTGKALHCDECGTSYWRKIDLERHLLKKHSEKSKQNQLCNEVTKQ